DPYALRAEVGLLDSFRKAAVEVGHQGTSRPLCLSVRLLHCKRQAYRAQVVFKAARDSILKGKLAGKWHPRRAERASGIRARRLYRRINRIDAVRGSGDRRLSRRDGTRLAGSS